ncbi:MAG TPA: cytochrome C oxidase subunit IV family protein [Bryobacteraceae bacterium]|jgi:cytochrome c oxidase subunit 4|nr:cytochrome C oxidase subunit IV family protein [Bryobacteraceae bacterium]
MTNHVTPVRTYVLVWLALMILTAVTWQVALLDLGSWNIVAAITIACIKMTLVIAIFMHARSVEALTKLYVLAGFFWLLILLAFFLMDYLSRSWQVVPRPY